MTDKDYTLLRPFDLEAAKAGEPLCWDDGSGSLKYIGPATIGLVQMFPDHHHACVWISGGFSGQVGIYMGSYLRMAPLAWVEGKPVYKGDVLYSSFFHGMDECETGMFEVTGFDGEQFKAAKLSHAHATKVSSCSWTPPKVKREGWVNLYAPTARERLSACSSSVFKTESIANDMAAEGRIACVRVEWEE